METTLMERAERYWERLRDYLYRAEMKWKEDVFN